MQTNNVIEQNPGSKLMKNIKPLKDYKLDWVAHVEKLRVLSIMNDEQKANSGMSKDALRSFKYDADTGNYSLKLKRHGTHLIPDFKGKWLVGSSLYEFDKLCNLIKKGLTEDLYKFELENWVIVQRNRAGKRRMKKTK
jgi:hypothetical protein